MKLRLILGMVMLVSVAMWGCNNNTRSDSDTDFDEIVQASDGIILLSMEDAYVLQDITEPKRNTAEWSFKVLNKGRYEVWLTSHTKDTMNLSYEKPVIVHFGDTRLEVQPVGNEIVLNDMKVVKPYFRADSRIGSILIEDTGSYNIQVISEKVVPPEVSLRSSASTIMDKLYLIPQTH
ncbi:MAG: hypothetical protein V2I37_05235 [Marinilabiliaceae bacterium]|jgi:hypothetical protein|nr:hypothetical protein [Marinilabiliaceae bacterium]